MLENKQKTNIESEIVTKTPETEENFVEEMAAESSLAEQNYEQLSPNLVERNKKPWLKYVVTACVLAVLAVLVAWSQGVFTITDIRALLGIWGDALAIPGFVAVCIGILLWASNGGAFDIFAYSTRSFARMFRKNMEKDKYHTYYDYREARKGQKRSFWYFVIVGGAYLLAGVVLLVVFSQMQIA